MEVVPVDKKGGLTRSEFERLANIPPEEEWLANIRNHKTRRAYRRDVREFVAFSRSISFEELRSVTRAHVIAWRKDLEARNKKGSTVRRRKLSSLSSLCWNRRRETRDALRIGRIKVRQISISLRRRSIGILFSNTDGKPA